ncbi:MAG: hypothetical protein M1829_001955 [Trizodia sp. TS-e1964]|nr:MAG: hypothetical protein M1829_001955 [Trizodia sp. TS-e1964]
MTTFDKRQFLNSYEQIRAEALTPQNIFSAYTKTGLVPFNPSIVLDELSLNSHAIRTPSPPPQSIEDLLAQTLSSSYEIGLYKTALQDLLDSIGVNNQLVTEAIEKIHRAAQVATLGSVLKQIDIDKLKNSLKKKKEKSEASRGALPPTGLITVPWAEGVIASKKRKWDEATAGKAEKTAKKLAKKAADKEKRAGIAARKAEREAAKLASYALALERRARANSLAIEASLIDPALL